MQTSETFWGRRAAGFDGKLPGKGANYAARLARAGAVMTPTSRVLDVGCATGEITLDLAARCGSILGIDTSRPMVELAQAKLTNRGLAGTGAAEGEVEGWAEGGSEGGTEGGIEGGARFAVMDPGDELLGAGSFDVITCYSVFHLANDWRAMVVRMHALLRPGGYVLNETPCLGDWSPLWRPVLRVAQALGQAPRVYRIKVVELEAAFTDAGLVIEESTVHNPKSGMHCIRARRPHDSSAASVIAAWVTPDRQAHG